VKPLRKGDVISFSAGTTGGDPRAFRVVRGGSVLGAVAARWPHLFAPTEGRLSLLINAYPAPIRAFEAGVLVDTYLSVPTARRALALATAEGMAVILGGQPLLLAEILVRHRDGNWPEHLLIATGGYPMPASLEAFLLGLCRPRCRSVAVLHLYGVAEVEASCLAAVDRDDRGRLVYHPRGPEIRADIDDGGQLLLSIDDPDPRGSVENFPTGDRAARAGGGLVLSNPARCSPEAEAELASWGIRAWGRRTGYIERGPGGWLYQLREGEAPDGDGEVEFFDFARRTSQSWLSKPRWR